MRRLFQDLNTRLQDLIGQRDTLLLLVGCRDEECAFVLKCIESIDDAGPDVFWLFAEPFVDPRRYADAVVESFRRRAEVLSTKMVESGDPEWPPVPARAIDPSVAPATRLQVLFMYARTRIPDLDASRLVVVLTPTSVTDPRSWRLFLRQLTSYEPGSPWCHHMRIVAREPPHVSLDGLSPELRSKLDVRTFPSTELYTVDFSLAALQRATRDEVADPTIPLPDRMQSLLIDANVDYANRRYVPAVRKFELLRRYYAAVKNQALLGATLNGLGEVYAAAGQRDRAIEHFEMGVTAAIDGRCNPVLLNLSLNLGNLYFVAKEWSEAVEHYVGAEALATALLNAHVKLLCLENIGVCRLALTEYAAAQEAWQNGATLARALDERAALKKMLVRLRGLYADARMRDRVRACDDELRGLS